MPGLLNSFVNLFLESLSELQNFFVNIFSGSQLGALELLCQPLLGVSAEALELYCQPLLRVSIDIQSPYPKLHACPMVKVGFRLCAKITRFNNSAGSSLAQGLSLSTFFIIQQVFQTSQDPCGQHDGEHYAMLSRQVPCSYLLPIIHQSSRRKVRRRSLHFIYQVCVIWKPFSLIKISRKYNLSVLINKSKVILICFASRHSNTKITYLISYRFQRCWTGSWGLVSRLHSLVFITVA